MTSYETLRLTLESGTDAPCEEKLFYAKAFGALYRFCHDFDARFVIYAASHSGRAAVVRPNRDLCRFAYSTCDRMEKALIKRVAKEIDSRNPRARNVFFDMHHGDVIEDDTIILLWKPLYDFCIEKYGWDPDSVPRRICNALSRVHPSAKPGERKYGYSVPVRVSDAYWCLRKGHLETPSFACAACNKGGRRLKLCAACEVVKYCNRSCQRSDFKVHKAQCKSARVFLDSGIHKVVVTEDDRQNLNRLLPGADFRNMRLETKMV